MKLNSVEQDDKDWRIANVRILTPTNGHGCSPPSPIRRSWLPLGFPPPPSSHSPPKQTPSAHSSFAARLVLFVESSFAQKSLVFKTLPPSLSLPLPKFKF
ncbi:hypothetical protein GE061_011348 [Apolygus lucorum]|uniref:Uncharacterized protein n=1 Tax=Apolygus lucorum TaxID=248454 RepID=A0A8S9XXK0_APOLU|nr:hypothetical protein GE061_011348 [Apolygus lucorum]